MNTFIPKLETENYYIGSFDAYIDTETKDLLLNKGFNQDEVNDYLKKMPTPYRASIVSKDTNEYVGFIGISNVDFLNDKYDLIFETKKYLGGRSKKEIINKYTKYLVYSLNLRNKNKTVSNDTSFRYLKLGIDENIIKRLNTQDLDKLKYSATIIDNNKILGVIGLSNLVLSNKRADLNIYLDKYYTLDPEYIKDFIEEYLMYVHGIGIHNVSCSIDDTNIEMLDALNESSMSYYATIPYSYSLNDFVCSQVLFQHIPNMNENKQYAYTNKLSQYPLSELEPIQTKLSNMISLSDNYMLVRPDKMSVKLRDNLLEGYIKSMQNRNRFTIPLGEDKYFLQRGNEKYGLVKALNNFNYVLMDSDMNFNGYINILREDKTKKNCEIEIGVAPDMQNRGLGSLMTEAFYKELFKMGYASVTSKVFSFNDISNHLINKLADYNGTRLESYYNNGKLWDMEIYTKVNPKINVKK